MRTSLTQNEIYDLLNDGTPESTKQTTSTAFHANNEMEKIKEYPKGTVAKAFKRLGAKHRESILGAIVPGDIEYFTSELSYENLQEMIQLILSMKIDQEEELTREAFQSLIEFLEETDNTVVIEKKRELLKGLCDSLQDEACLHSIITQFEQTDPVLAGQLKSTLISEAVLMETDDRGIQRWLREVDTSNLAIFLKYCDCKLKDKIMSNLSQRLGAMIEEDISVMGPYHQEGIKTTKNRLFTIYRMLVEAGEIMHPYAVI